MDDLTRHLVKVGKACIGNEHAEASTFALIDSVKDIIGSYQTELSQSQSQLIDQLNVNIRHNEAIQEMLESVVDLTVLAVSAGADQTQVNAILDNVLQKVRQK